MNPLQHLLGEKLYEEVTLALKGKGREGKDVELAIANDGSFLPKAKFDTIYNEYQELKNQVAQKDEEFSKAALAKEEHALFKQQLEEELGESQKIVDQLKKDMAVMEKNHALEKEFSGAKAKNHKAVEALLDWEKVSFEHGTFEGLKEQLDTLKSDAPYLFENSSMPFSYEPRSGRASLEYEKMSDAEYYQYIQEKG